MKHLLRWLLNRCDRFEIGDGRDDIFFVRYRLLKLPWLGVYLHEFLRSDKDRCLHDHPWSFTTIILRGGYFETVRYFSMEQRHEETHWRPRGYLGRYPASHAHRITLAPTGPKPWSLVIVGRKSRDWGFYGPNGWVAWVKGQGNPVCEEGRINSR